MNVLKFSRPVQIILLALLLAAFVFSTGWVLRVNAQDMTPNQGSAAYNPDAEVEYICTIANIAAYTNRIHVRCNAAPPGHPGVVYFAAPSDPNNIFNSNRYLMMLNTAYALNKPVGVRFESSNTANPAGCLATDCRRITGIYLIP